MKISELVTRLVQAMAFEGDVDVVIRVVSRDENNCAITDRCVPVSFISSLVSPAIVIEEKELNKAVPRQL